MIECALFGAGRIGKIHAGNVAREAGARLKYVIDPNKDAASALAAEHGASTATTEQVFADKAIGAVLICSYTDTHADLILAAAAAGKQIFCEKPIDLAIARARTCAEAVAKARVTCMIGFQRRFDPTFSAAKTRLAAGEIGTPEMLIVTSRDPGAPPIPYIKSSGGIFKDMLIHDFDVFRWILEDEAETVHANASCLVDPTIGEAGDVDSTAVTIRTKDGSALPDQHESPRGVRLRPALRGVRKRRHAAGRQPPAHRSDRLDEHCGEPRPAAALFPRALPRCVRERDGALSSPCSRARKRSVPPIDDGLKALELAEAATTSWREGRIVKM
jgi:myo-inositol 2-dehydrogenase/D-chiro-inositol 1-dehydrogenase